MKLRTILYVLISLIVNFLPKPPYNTVTKDREHLRIAKAVLMTFKGPPPEDMIDPTVDHIDGNVINNDISNLRWLTRSMILKKSGNLDNMYRKDSTGKFKEVQKKSA